MPARKSWKPFHRWMHAVALAAAVVALASPAAAAQCCDDWDEPYICRLELSGTESMTSQDPDQETRSIRIAPGKAVRIAVTAFDQYGRAFPGEEIRYQIESEDCGTLVATEILAREQIELKAASRSGSCELKLWIPGNRNLDATLRVDVSPVAPLPKADSRSAVAAGRLFRAILGRDAASGDIRNLAQVIARGDTRSWLDTTLRGAEFQRRRATLSSEELLRSVYEGLLRRQPDASGQRSYLPLFERGAYAETVMRILASPEFERSVREELAE